MAIASSRTQPSKTERRCSATASTLSSSSPVTSAVGFHTRRRGLAEGRGRCRGRWPPSCRPRCSPRRRALGIVWRLGVRAGRRREHRVPSSGAGCAAWRHRGTAPHPRPVTTTCRSRRARVMLPPWSEARSHAPSRRAPHQHGTARRPELEDEAAARTPTARSARGSGRPDQLSAVIRGAEGDRVEQRAVAHPAYVEDRAVVERGPGQPQPERRGAGRVRSRAAGRRAPRAA